MDKPGTAALKRIINHQTAEIERLRDALERIVSMPILSDRTPMQQRGDMKAIAIQALEKVNG